MTKVNVLPPDVISKIAAGEVIDRPASVLKETVENALDAGATSIEVTLKDAGKTLLQIKDNGHGIAKDDLEKVFLRHATSKIKTSDDLFDIHSLGFRGEALYSVAAIAHIQLKSKTDDQDSGWEIHMRGGEQLNLKPCALGTTGTEITIQELFYNTPARKKFLKTNASEMHQILNTFIPYTLLHTQCRFKLTHQDKTSIDLAPTDNIVDRISDTLNLDKKHMLEAQQDFPSRKCTIHLVLGDINIKRTRRDMQFLFINGRPVQSKNIFYHLNQIYRLIMAPEEFGFFCAYITLPPEDIDVNIHPTKREVKIKDENGLCSLIRRMAESTLMSGGSIRHIQDKARSDNYIKPSSIDQSLRQSHSRAESFDHS
ncbi:MAG: DNA mismatch repair endonuclease MutL, partial [Candidatus Omnitrophica bacterium]|nr:DNA mismatch repair endonuclease MutL [Candidatus Omnitrophota bacterium]